MKYSFLALIVFFTHPIFAQNSSSIKSTIQIPAKDKVEIDYPNWTYYKVVLNKKRNSDLDIAVVSKESNEQIKGFGLGYGDVDIYVEAANKLVITNKSSVTASISLKVSEAKQLQKDNREYVSFTLRNESAKSIPLIIPTVMNPNLSPMSNSGVDLKIGQEIFFRIKGKNYVLLTVDESIQNGEIIKVAALLKARKVELGLD